MAPTHSSDKRKHKRYPLTDDTVAICNSSIGSVLDISEGGLGIKYLKPKELPEEGNALVFSGERDFLVSELPIKIVRKEELEISPLSDAHTQTVGVKFNNPDSNQYKQIQQFVSTLSKS